MSDHTPSKKIEEIAKQLGPLYSVKWMDGENVVYRKLNDNYDIEISGLDSGKRKFSCTIFFWSLKPGMQIEATFEKIDSIERLHETLQSLERKYG